MGGQFYSKDAGAGRPALYVPRMTPRLYNALKRFVNWSLLSIFRKADTVYNAPWKSSFGDIDVITQEFTAETNSKAPMKDIANAAQSTLRAERCTITSSNSMTLAVAFQEVNLFRIFSKNDPNLVTVQKMIGDLAEDNAYFQLDLHIHHDPIEFRYAWFKSAYADGSNLLALSMRRVGLTFVDAGLALNLEHLIGYTKGKPRRLILSQSEDAILEFLNLDRQETGSLYKTKAQLFNWIVSCRYFQPIPPNRDRSASQLLNRPLIDDFVFKWWPENQHNFQIERLDRTTVLKEAVWYFDKQGELDRMIDEHTAQQNEALFWKNVQFAIPLQGNKLNHAIRALRRWVVMRHCSSHNGKVPVYRDEAEMSAALQPLWTHECTWSENELLNWVRNHWQDLVEREKSRQKQVADARQQEQSMTQLVRSVEVMST